MREGNPQSPDAIRALTAKLPHDAGMIWALCLSGMRRGEYWGSWEVLPDRLTIRGTKSKAAMRSVPLVYPIERPSRNYWRFTERLHRATDGAVRCHDLRKTAMGWWEDAGIPRTRRRMYLGHAVGDVSELYERRDVTRYLVEDAERVRCAAWLGCRS